MGCPNAHSQHLCQRNCQYLPFSSGIFWNRCWLRSKGRLHPYSHSFYQFLWKLVVYSLMAYLDHILKLGEFRIPKIVHFFPLFHSPLEQEKVIKNRKVFKKMRTKKIVRWKAKIDGWKINRNFFVFFSIFGHFLFKICNEISSLYFANVIKNHPKKH